MPDEPDSENKLSPEQIYWELKPGFEDMIDSVAINQKVYEAAEKELGRIAREHFPGMKNYWQAKQFQDLANLLSRTAADFCLKLSDLDYAASQTKG
jgi:hypothetical protein